VVGPTVGLAAALYLILYVEAGLDVGQQLVRCHLAETGDRLAEALAESGLGGIQQELPERLFRDALRLGVQNPRHLQLEKARVRAVATALTTGIATRAASWTAIVALRRISIRVIVTSAIVHRGRPLCRER
jgi:hypothetical protein